MRNDEGMTKSEAQKPDSADDSFRNGDTDPGELHLIFSKIWRGRKNE